MVLRERNVFKSSSLKMYLVALLCLSSSFGYAQISDIQNEPTIEGKPYRSYFSDYILKQFNYHLAEIGIKGISYVRFRVENDSLLDISCDSSTPKQVADFFKKMVVSTSTKWLIREEENTIYVLPIYYTFQYKGKYKVLQSPSLQDFLSGFFIVDNLKAKKSFCQIKVLYPVEVLSPYQQKIKPASRGSGF